MQMFTKMANRWAERVCADAECVAFREELAKTDVRVTMAHDSYLINLASPDPMLRRRSIDSFIAELRRCEALGLDLLVSHPGNHMGDLVSGIHRNADAITEALLPLAFPNAYATAYNRWMNEKLYAVAAGMSDDERKADRGAFFGSVHGTLNHLLAQLASQ